MKLWRICLIPILANCLLLLILNMVSLKVSKVTPRILAGFTILWTLFFNLEVSYLICSSTRGPKASGSSSSILCSSWLEESSFEKILTFFISFWAERSFRGIFDRSPESSPYFFNLLELTSQLLFSVFVTDLVKAEKVGEDKISFNSCWSSVIFFFIPELKVGMLDLDFDF